MTKPSRPSYSYEFKVEIAQRHLAGESATELATQYELSSETLVDTWARTLRREGPEALRPRRRGRPPGTSTTPKTEVEQLRAEKLRLEAENAYLKKLWALRGKSAQS